MRLEQPEILSDKQAIIDHVREIRDSLYGLKGKEMEIMERVANLSGELLKKYPDAKNYYLFHIMIGSTPRSDKLEPFDFPDKDSVVKQLEALCQEYDIKLNGEK